MILSCYKVYYVFMMMPGINKTSCVQCLVSHMNVTETTIIGVPSGIRSGNDGNHVSFPSFLPTSVRLSICASCVRNRSAINVGRPSKRITVCDCFIYHARYFYRSRNSRKRMKRVGGKNRYLEWVGERKKGIKCTQKKISGITRGKQWIHKRTK